MNLETLNLNPNNPQQRAIGYWMFRLATAHADRPRDLKSHTQWLERNLRSAVGAIEQSQRDSSGTRKQVPDASSSKSAPMTLQEAQARTAVLMAKL
jgi:hypothetical protein